MQKKLNMTLAIVAVSILGYFAYALWIGLNETASAISQLGWVGVWIVLGLSLLNYALRFIRWQWYLSDAEPIALTRWQSLRYYIAGFALTATPGKAGEMVRSLFLKRHAVSYTQSVAMFFVERLSDLIALIFMASLILWEFSNYRYWILIAVVLVVIGMILMRQEQWLQRWKMRLEPRLPVSIQHSLTHLLRLISHSRALLQARFLYGGLVLSLLAWGAEGIGFYYTTTALDLNISIYTALGIYATSLVIGALSFLPGGLGGAEVVMLLLLSAAGASHEEALAATLICRIATLWFAILLGALAILGLNLNTLSETPDSI